MTAHAQPPTDHAQVLRGILAEFADPGTLVSAARSVREAGLKRWDSYSPFPVHGIEGAMGIRPTVLPWLVLGAGITGGAVALLMQWWTNAVNYPLNISGKPLFSLPANIPVTFELIILFSALTAFFGVLALNGLPRFNNPLLDTGAISPRHHGSLLHLHRCQRRGIRRAARAGDFAGSGSHVRRRGGW